MPHCVFSQLERFAELAGRIERARGDLTALLRNIESQETIDDELFKSIDALRNADIEAPYFGRKLATGASFLPLNLPLYSLVLFGVLPTAVVERLSVRAPARLGDVVGRIGVVLGIPEAFPGLRISSASREEFVRDHTSSADLVIFTGKSGNAQKLRPHLRKDALFLFSGRGINPLVIAADADMEAAIAKTAKVKLFNSGQDCAAPDCIFVHASRSRELLDGLRERLAAVVVGRYDDPRVRVGPLIEIDQLSLAAKHLAENRENLVFGGVVDFLAGIVHPSIVFYPRFEKANSAELFSPVFFVTEYDSEAQLRSYFDSSQYRQNAMYVSLFGTSTTLAAQRHSIVLRDRIVNEVERGNLEYGGFSAGASFVQYGPDVKAQPILVSREVSEHLAWRERFDEVRGHPGQLVEEQRQGVTIYRARGPLPGNRLLVVASIDGERSGAYACHRLLHELRSRRTRIDCGEITLAVPMRAGDAVIGALAREADYTLVLRAHSTDRPPFVVADFCRSVSDPLAESLGTEINVIDPASPTDDRAVVVQCGDDADPHTSNVAFDVVMNAARHLDIIGGEARGWPAARQRFASAPVVQRTAASSPRVVVG
jgi:aldehyde dehydrogenase (NAD+)